MAIIEEIELDSGIRVNKEYRCIAGNARLSALKDIYPNGTLVMVPVGDGYEVIAIRVAKSAQVL